MLRSLGSVMAKAVVAVGVLVGASSASAQSVEGALRVHLETNAAALLNITRTDGETDTERSATAFSIGPTASSVGVFTSTFGLGLGYGVTESVVIGSNFTLRHLSAADDEGDETLTLNELAVRPYAELVLGEGSLRPFVGLQGLIGHAWNGDSSATVLGVNALAGAHVFLADAASLDLSLQPLIQQTTDNDDDDTTTMFGVMAMIGVSAWAH